MLTQDDLKQIRKVVREEVTTEVKDATSNLEGQIRITKMEIRNDINDLDDRMKNVEIRVDNVGEGFKIVQNDLMETKNSIKSIETGMKKMHKDLKKEIKGVLHFLDRENMSTRKRVLKIERHLALPQEN